MKRCKNCKKEKAYELFYKHLASKDGYRNICIECSIEYRNTIGRNRQLKRKYGIGVEEYNRLLLAQNNQCAICLTKSGTLHVDHDHETGQVRGLLCYNCNMGLGRFKDSSKFLNAAVSYLLRGDIHNIHSNVVPDKSKN